MGREATDRETDGDPGERRSDDGSAEARLEDGNDSESESPPECHRRDCAEPAAFRVLERYQEETGAGAVEAAAHLCRAHAADESPANIDAAYDDYVFRVDPIESSR